ncbi:MAG TPA: hypothetical protein VKI17_13370 [Gemmataceae bacterium]|nr:hypothetical protein [Gemmataceae bacterium]
MQTANTLPRKLTEEMQSFYGDVLDLLQHAGLPFLVGGGYAFACHTSIHRQTKDLDIFVRPRDYPRTLDVCVQAGYRAETTFEHWLGKIFAGEDFIDVIFSSGNGVAAVDDDWFVHSVEEEIFGRPVRLIPPEEMIWSKAFIMERERYDGADIAHLLRVKGKALDWKRLLRYFASHWQVLLSHLILYDYIYPGEPRPMPVAVMNGLLHKWTEQKKDHRPNAHLCRGTLLSRAQYLVDIEDWGYEDARRSPTGSLSDEEIATWTEAIPAELRHQSSH